MLQQLATADRQWLPRAETLASGAVRYHYRRRANEPKLSVAELRALIANPPSFGAERLAIGELLTVLAKAGVLLELGQPRKLGAAGEWDPAARTMRIQPRVVAKGVDHLAQKIREVAKQHGVPVVENPPLARGLHAAVEVDQEIPVEFYRAVAELIGYVMRLRGRLAGARR